MGTHVPSFQFINLNVSGIAENIPKLSPNRGSTIFIDRVVAAPQNFLQYAEVSIHATYKPTLIPFTFTENIRFKTERKNTGEYVWPEYFNKNIFFIQPDPLPYFPLSFV